MVEVNDAFQQGKYERIWLKHLTVKPDVKAFAKDDIWMDGRTDRLSFRQMNTTEYTGPYVTLNLMNKIIILRWLLQKKNWTLFQDLLADTFTVNVKL